MRLLGFLVNLALRAGMFALLKRVRRADPNDPRYVDKGIAPRMSMLVPATQGVVPLLWLRHRRGGYPFWMDSLFMSIVALDLAGNVYDLYDRYKHFDLIPHSHGAGAITVFFAWAPGLPVLSAIGVSTVGHILLEVQEWWGDQFYGFRNVRGTWDIIGDLGAGVVGTIVYAGPFLWFVRNRGREPAKVLG